MDKIKFDEPRLKEMEQFLIRIYQIAKENLDVILNDSLVYNELCKYELSSSDIGENNEYVNCADLFKKWTDRNKNVGSLQKGLTVFHQLSWPHFLQFFSNGDDIYFHKNRDFIKLYIPIKYNKLEESVNILFDYICDSKIRHLSKVADMVRTDNVIVRLAKDDIESALKIIDFIHQNDVLKNSLNKTNPFIPTINGIGFMYETGISYNQEMAILIAQYLRECIKKQTPPVLSDFYKWFKENNYSFEVNNIFASSIGEDDATEIKENKSLSEQEKYQLLIDAVKATFLKYSFKQAIGALKILVDYGSYDYFTNGTGEIKYRDLLRKNVTKEDAIRYVKTFMNNNIMSNKNIIEFCREILKKNLLDEFNEACLVTCMNYDEMQLQSALKRMINENDAMGFSRFSKDDALRTKNYRDVIKKYDRNAIINLIQLAIDATNVDFEISNVDMLIPLFTDNIAFLAYSIDTENKRKK